MERRIAHVDLDAFFASVEELLNPDLRGQPIIVGGATAGRGVVSSASYPARAFGVRSAMPVRQALQLCPRAVVVPPRHGVYGSYSTKVMAVLREYSDLVEPASVDDAFLDVTQAQSGAVPPDYMARVLQHRIRQDVGLPCTVGVASNKLLAKMATERGKPGGLVVVPPGGERAFLADRPAEELWGVGARTVERLRSLGFVTIGQLAEAPPAVLEQQFGAMGHWLREAAQGRDERPVRSSRPRRSASCEHTFDKDVSEQNALEHALLRLAERVARRLWLAHLFGRTVRLKLRYGDFETITRAETLEHTFNLDEEIYRVALRLFRRCWHPGRQVRLLGVGVADLSTEERRQLGLFSSRDERLGRLSRAVNELKDRFGDDALTHASLAGWHGWASDLGVAEADEGE